MFKSYSSLRVILLFSAISFLVSCSGYKIAERHLNGKMKRFDLVQLTWVNELNGDTVEYWDNSNLDKPVMLLVHGFWATSKYQFDKQIKMLTEDYRIVMPNLYHFGNTRPGSEKYSIQDQVDLLINLLQELKIETYSLMGVSYGGLIGIELANMNKDKVNQMILFDAPIKYVDTNDINSITDFYNAPSIEELFVPEKPEGLKKLILLATGKKSHLPKILFMEFLKEAYTYNLLDKRALITSMINGLEEYQSRHYEFDIPILLIWGEDDMVVSASKGLLLQKHLGIKCKYHVIKKAAHMPNMTNSKEFNSLLYNFLNSTIQ
tara:strand:+ start:98 stop:1057 length:960 start_codon:yes stop_codon:yes gene_type:complete